MFCPKKGRAIPTEPRSIYGVPDVTLLMYEFRHILNFSNVSTELPSPATVFQADGVKVQLLFEAEFSNVLIVNARVQADGNSEARVNFEMPKVRTNIPSNKVRVIILYMVCTHD